MLEIQTLTAGYPDHPVLQEASLSIPSGSVTVIAGPNGSGKSTLLKALAGILPKSGQILLDGEDLTALPGKELAKRLAYLPQSRQIPEITVQRLVLHGRFPYLGYPRRYGKEDLAIARQAMEQLGIPDLAQRRLAALSGGQRQKVYIAMALAQQTPVVLMDEPTTYLDIAQQIQMMHHAQMLAREGKTVVLVLHDLAMALEWADQLVILSGGQVVCQGAPEAVFTSGILPQIFGVSVQRTQMAEGWKYFYQRHTD